MGREEEPTCCHHHPGLNLAPHAGQLEQGRSDCVVSPDPISAGSSSSAGQGKWRMWGEGDMPLSTEQR